MVYKPLKNNAIADSDMTQNLWVRPLSMFLETVETDAGNIPRFEYMGSSNVSLSHPAGNREGPSFGRRVLQLFSRKVS